MPPSTVSTEWCEVSRDFYRSVCGNFDIWDTRRGYWCAVDAETGGIFRGEKLECVVWCAARNKGDGE